MRWNPVDFAAASDEEGKDHLRMSLAVRGSANFGLTPTAQGATKVDANDIASRFKSFTLANEGDEKPENLGSKKTTI